LLTHIASVTKQYNLVLVERW